MERESFFQPEKRVESIVDLSEIKMTYISDEDINTYYAQEIEKVKNKDEWIAQAKNRISQESISRGFREGVIQEESIEAVWQYVYSRRLGEIDEVKKLCNKIEVEVTEIMQETSLRLAKFIPNWKPENITINFTINEDANFCVDSEGKNITADLVRLTVRDNPDLRLIEGVAHELVHCWMRSGKNNKDGLTEKDSILHAIAEEGLTTYIAENDLQKHHGKNDEEYEEYKKESLELFHELLLTGDDVDFEKYYKGFEDMGFCYVAGNEIVKAVVKKIGIEKFRELLLKIKENPTVLFEEYDNA